MLNVIDCNKIFIGQGKTYTDDGRLANIQRSIDEFDDPRLRIILQEAWDRAASCQQSDFPIER